MDEKYFLGISDICIHGNVILHFSVCFPADKQLFYDLQRTCAPLFIKNLHLHHQIGINVTGVVLVKGVCPFKTKTNICFVEIPRCLLLLLFKEIYSRGQ